LKKSIKLEIKASMMSFWSWYN